jgi:hypothetical protein
MLTLFSLTALAASPQQTPSVSPPVGSTHAPSQARCPVGRAFNTIALSGLGVTGLGGLSMLGGALNDDEGVETLGHVATGVGVGVATIGASGMLFSGHGCSLRRSSRWGGVGALGASLGTASLLGGMSVVLWDSLYAVEQGGLEVGPSGTEVGTFLVIVGGGLVGTSVVPVVLHQVNLRQVRVAPVLGRAPGVAVSARF